MGNIVSFEDFQRRSKKELSEDTLMPTGNSTVFVDDEEGAEGHHKGSEDHHGGEEKNYMFFKNLYTMKRCIEDMMAMDKEQVDELIERGHDWASDHISSAKDDLQEVSDWLRYEIDNHEGDHGDDDEDEEGDDIEVDNIEIEPEDSEEGDDEDDDEDDEEDDVDGEEEEEDDKKEETLESREPNYSYEEEKN
jgi:hypothetical protein